MFYDLLFDKEFASANRLIKDSHPYEIIKGEGKDTIMINALGVAEDDIKVSTTLTDGGVTYLCIEGETKNDVTKAKYNFKNRFSINRAKVQEIKYSTKDGILYVDVIYKETSVEEIPISKN